jgi:hypothetical protein
LTHADNHSPTSIFGKDIFAKRLLLSQELINDTSFKLFVKFLDKDIFRKLINWAKNWVASAKGASRLQPIYINSFTLWLPLVARTLYLRLLGIG